MCSGRRFVYWLALSLSAAACRQESMPDEPALPDEPAPPRVPAREAAPALSAPTPPSASPLASQVAAFEKELQRSKLVVPPDALHLPRLAFARGALAQLTKDAVVVYDTKDFHELLREPLGGPKALLALADGGLVAIGSRQLLHWQPGWKHAKSLALPSLLPGVELFADAQQADRLWVFEARGSAGAPSLVSYRLAAGELTPLPEQTIELTSPRGGVLGITREGVWLYLTPGREERLGPSGQRLPGATFSAWLPRALPTWALATRRLDQALWLDEAGNLSRFLTGSKVQGLGSPLTLPGKPYAVAVGDEGRLLASVLIMGEGPRFELELRDAELQPLARVALPSDAPTGADDWLDAVTANEHVAVAPHAALVAVGGPLRLAIFSAQGQQLFSKSSQ